MNKSSSSASSSSPPFTTLPPPPTQRSNLRSTPSVIPLEYNYRVMSPSSLSHRRENVASHNATRSQRPQTAATSQVSISIDQASPQDQDNQYSSLFGDPVPPPPPSEFLSTQFDSMYSAATATVTEFNGSSEEEPNFGRTVTLDAPARLFSNVPYTSLLSRQPSNGSVEHTFDIFPTALPRLQPPDIQILPHSSGGSSSEPHDSPNYAFLAPDDILRRPTIYDIAEPADVTELSETITINDASGRREYSEAMRRVSNFGNDFQSNVGSFGSPPLDDIPTTTHAIGRQLSNESYSSSEWFRPTMNDFPEFSKMPKLRPSSKNVMSIKRDEMPTQHSPVAAMINDSNGSSSGGEERLLNATQTLSAPTVPLDILSPLRPPDPTSTLLREFETRSPQRSTPQRRRSSTESVVPSFSPPPPIPPAPNLDVRSDFEDHTSIKREMSPVIVRDSIATGSDFRVDQLRLHKKTSFTIISDRSPQSSRSQTPTTHSQNLSKPLSGSFSYTPTPTPTPSSITTSQPVAKPRHHLHRKSLTTTQLRLPQFSADDSPRPSVQFNMSGRYSPGKMPQKGILQNRESFSSSQDTPLPPQITPTPPPVPSRRPSLLPLVPSPGSLYQDHQKMRSYETLPIITDPYRTAIPRLNRSSMELRPESAIFPPGALPRPLKPNPNPTRNQRGLLRIINSAENLSRIPQRSNWTVSADDLDMEKQRRPSLTPLSLGVRRRSSSTSPERRSSTQTASDRRSSNLSSVTTSDFSFRRSSLTDALPSRDRRKSIFPTASSGTTPKRRRPSVTGATKQQRTGRIKVAKPTTLSPIIGTPNKENAPQSPVRRSTQDSIMNVSETMSDTTSRRGSISKIPVRSAANSRSNSRLSSHPGSRVQSRSSSPTKEFATQLPLSGRTSRTASSRSPSRATTGRSESRPTSRADSRAAAASRSTSRASTRPISRGPPSRSSSRPNSRMEQAREIANSRSNSRLSSHSPDGRTTSMSPSVTRKRVTVTPSRRKSISLSPKPNRKASTTHRSSLSPPSRKQAARNGKPLERRRSRSKIPTRAKSDLTSVRTVRPSSKSKSPELKRTVSARKTSPTPRSVQPNSAKKAPTTVRKPESSVKRVSSSVGKPPATSTKKQPSNTQKTANNLKREPTNLQKKPTPGTGRTPAKSTVKREESALNLKKKTGPEAKGELKKQNSSKQIGKTHETKGSGAGKAGASASAAGGGGAGTSGGSNSSTGVSKSEATAAVDQSATIAAAATATGALMGGLKRQPSTMSLLRMGSRLSLLNKKRPDSSLSRHISEEPEGSAEISATEAAASHAAQLHKVGSSGQLTAADAILEKSQKTLENVQKTVTVATDEIHRSINENLTDLKTLEQDVGKVSDGASSPTPSVTTVVENKANKGGASASRGGTAEKSPLPPTQPIEASVSVLNTGNVGGDGGAAVAAERVSGSTAISVLPEVDCESANFQNFELGIEDKQTGVGVKDVDGTEIGALTDEPSTSSGVDGIAKQRRSPDGQGGSTAGSGGDKRTGSRELLESPDDEAPPKGCCRCCARFCMPCRRARCSRCCRRNKNKSQILDESDDRPVLSATSSTTTTNLEVIDETAKKKHSCWQKLNCLKKKDKAAAGDAEEDINRVQTPPLSMGPAEPRKQGKCGACLRRVFCCRSANKIEAATSDDEDTEQRKCCACLPCRRKKPPVVGGGSTPAWQDPEQGITATDAAVLEGAEGDPSAAGGDAAAVKQGCCKRFWSTIFCCCRKKAAPVPSGSRRASMRAPPPPAEDTRRKLHVDLVEYNSKMKGAIPVLPLFLAWFCAICNVVVPGLGTLFSGIFCVCVGIPRFSQYDSARARLGSFIINTIVAAAQLFCVLFCFVGWGWSIWWGTIMLRCARKLKKIRKVERLEMEEEQRQAAAAALAQNREAPTETTKN